jgi:hypothetical protein
MIARLFAIEAGIKGKPPAERLAARRAKATPILAELRAFLDATMGKLSGKSSLAGAFRYVASRWIALTRYVGDGRLEMSNAAERAIRPLALGRKNYLFAGSDEGGRRAAIMYTLIETARLNDVDPEGLACRRHQPHSRSPQHEDRRTAPMEMERSQFAGHRRIVARGRHITLTFIAPGKPMQNGFCESFNGRMRDEFLNEASITPEPRSRTGSTTTIGDGRTRRWAISHRRPMPPISPQHAIGCATPTICGRPLGKLFLRQRLFGDCGHMSGLSMRGRSPLAMMLSASSGFSSAPRARGAGRGTECPGRRFAGSPSPHCALAKLVNQVRCDFGRMSSITRRRIPLLGGTVRRSS